MTTYVNEASTCTVRARFFDVTGSHTAPNTARYLIKDLSNDRIVRDWTSLTPLATIDIEIAASDNEIYGRSERAFEHRVLTIQADHGQVGQRTDEIEYYIRNLSGVDEDD